MANYAGLWFPGQLPVFLIGMMVFYVARGLHNKFDPGALEIALAVCVTFILIAPMKWPIFEAYSRKSCVSSRARLRE